MDVDSKQPDEKLNPRDLADAIYSGSPHLRDLATKLANQWGINPTRQRGFDVSFPIFELMPEDIQNFYLHVAQILIDHSKAWSLTSGGIELSKEEADRLRKLSRHPLLAQASAGITEEPKAFAGPEINNSGFDLLRDGATICQRCGRVHPMGEVLCRI